MILLLNDSTKIMAGHNKWAEVKQLKGALDAKRAKIFSNAGFPTLDE